MTNVTPQETNPAPGLRIADSLELTVGLLTGDWKGRRIMERAATAPQEITLRPEADF